MRRLARWLTTIGFCMVVFVGQTSLALAKEVANPAQDKHFFWKIESEENTLYLLGSIHVLQENSYPLAPIIYYAFNHCGTIMFEVDLDSLSSPMSQLQLLTKGFYVNGDTLQTVLAPEQYEKAKHLMAGLGHDIGSFHRMKPWMAATAVTALELQKVGFEGEFGVDRHMFQMAQEADVTIVGLETVEYQMGLFDNLPIRVQEYFLLQSLEDLENIEVRVKEMVTAWEHGQVQELEALLSGMKEYPELYQSLVVTRNRNWLPQIEEKLKQKGPVFVVVGALHLLGEEGLLAELKKKGYRIHQM